MRSSRIFIGVYILTDMKLSVLLMVRGWRRAGRLPAGTRRVLWPVAPSPVGPLSPCWPSTGTPSHAPFLHVGRRLPAHLGPRRP